MSRLINIDHLIGTKKDNYTILSFAETSNNSNIRLNVICECGHKYIKTKYSILNCKTKFCVKCVHLKSIKNFPEYQSWKCMRARVTNKNHQSYKNYGGRGIKICDRWNLFRNFVDDMGPRPNKSYSIDRIDNDGDYEPNNCRWATKKVQMNNRKDRIYYRYPIRKDKACSICICADCIIRKKI